MVMKTTGRKEEKEYREETNKNQKETNYIIEGKDKEGEEYKRKTIINQKT